MKRPIIIAHRGASAYAPENTMSAFRKALSLGAEGIELDVHMTRDGHVVVIHDDKIDRTSNGKGFVKDYSLNELREFDFGSWFGKEFEGEKIPLLEDVLDLLKGWTGLLNIEIKSGPTLHSGIEEKVADIIKKYDFVDYTIISSFNHYSLVKMKKILPEVRTGVLYSEGIYEPWVYAKHVGAYAIHPSYYNIVPEIMEGCIKHGIAVNPFTVDDPDLIRKIAAAGVTGIITNVPDVALNTLSEV